MGRHKKGFNCRARTNVAGETDNTETKKLAAKVDLVDTAEENSSNALVLPSKKRKFLPASAQGPVGRILSRKRRKHLEKIVERKKKKEERGELLAKLQTCQADDKILDKMISLSTVQTRGLKRQFAEDSWKEKMAETGVPVETVIVNSMMDEVAKKVRYKKPKKEKPLEEQPVMDDPNVLGFDESDSGSEEDSDFEEEELEEEINKVEEELEEETNKVEEELEEETNNKVEEVEVEKVEEVKKDVEVKKVKEEEPAIYVAVNRTKEIQAAREKLPILSEEHAVMDAIRHNDVVIVAGETGSGKTTQVPQFLYEAGFTSNDKLIGITEPRRVAAIAMSNRVAEEMNLGKNEDKLVSYQIRFDDKTKEETTRLKFMTDGILLREAEGDPYLSRYSAVIIDEAHERSVSTDILIGHLSKYVSRRNEKHADTMGKLKLIIMSATLRVEDFMPDPSRRVQLFSCAPPLIKVETRQFDVSVHFNRRTPVDPGEYLDEAYRKVCKIHKTLPEGGILVFVTGQDEVKQLVRKLRQTFPDKKKKLMMTEDQEESHLETALKRSKKQKKKKQQLPNVNLDNYNVMPGSQEEDHNSDQDLDEDSLAGGGGGSSLSQPLWTLPLFSKLDPLEQAKIFKAPPEGHRMCVVATNVAETSLTIPGTKYVVDTGKMKVRMYDKVTGVSTYQVVWTSKAQADQRAGRAGRQGPGHCYRLYSSSVFQEFEAHALPDIRCRPVDDVVLQLKSMGRNNVMDFPFPTPPDSKQILTAEKHLKMIGALDSQTGKITELGQTIAVFPVAPRFGKMLALSCQHNLAPYVVTMVAALSMQEVLLETPVDMKAEDALNKYDLAEIRRKWAGSEANTVLLGDAMVLLGAVCAAEFAGCSRDFCDRSGLRYKAMMEIRKLRRQLANEMPQLEVVLDPNMRPPGDKEAHLLRQILLSGMGDRVARKVPEDEIGGEEEKQKWKFAYHTRTMEQPVFLHQNSVLKSALPTWVLYQEVYEVEGKIYMRGVTAIDPKWLPDFCPNDCRLSRPLNDREPTFEPKKGQIVSYRPGTFGERAWILPLIQTEHPVLTDRIKYFARYLLEGQVLDALKPFVSKLATPPIVMLKKGWNDNTPHGKRAKLLYEELASQNVDSCDRLYSVFKANPQFLKQNYKSWLKDDESKTQLDTLWPPL